MIEPITNHPASLIPVPQSANQPHADQAFEQQLYEAIANSLARLGSGASQIQVNVQETGQLPGAPSGNRQYIITVCPVDKPGPAPPTPPAAGPSATGPMDHLERLPPIPSSRGSVRDLDNPLPKLTELLRSMGVDASGLKFELVDDVVQNLGGDYVNHSIRTRFPSGYVEDFSVEWTLRNPMVTAVEIQRLLKLGVKPV